MGAQAQTSPPTSAAPARRARSQPFDGSVEGKESRCDVLVLFTPIVGIFLRPVTEHLLNQSLTLCPCVPRSANLCEDSTSEHPTHYFGTTSFAKYENISYDGVVVVLGAKAPCATPHISNEKYRALPTKGRLNFNLLVGSYGASCMHNP